MSGRKRVHADDDACPIARIESPTKETATLREQLKAAEARIARRDVHISHLYSVLRDLNWHEQIRDDLKVWGSDADSDDASDSSSSSSVVAGPGDD
jgi:hypothetical protein